MKLRSSKRNSKFSFHEIHEKSDKRHQRRSIHRLKSDTVKTINEKVIEQQSNETNSINVDRSAGRQVEVLISTSTAVLYQTVRNWTADDKDSIGKSHTSDVDDGDDDGASSAISIICDICDCDCVAYPNFQKLIDKNNFYGRMNMEPDSTTHCQDGRDATDDEDERIFYGCDSCAYRTVNESAMKRHKKSHENKRLRPYSYRGKQIKISLVKGNL